MIRAGLFLSAQHPPEAFTTAEVVRQCCEQTAFARDAGFDLVMAGQHFVSDPYAMLQSVPLLARVAAEAGEMRVGAGIVLLTLLNPVEVAENAATLDAITDGRYVLGVGYGYRQVENDAFALPERRMPDLRGQARRRAAPARRRDGRRRRPRLRPARRAPDAAAGAGAAAAVAGRELRPHGAARGAPRRRVAPEPAHAPRRAGAAGGAVPRGASRGRPGPAGARCRSSRSCWSAPTTRARCARRALPGAEVRGLRALGAERRAARGRHAAAGVGGARRRRPLRRRRAGDVRAPDPRARRPGRHRHPPLPLPVAGHAAGAGAGLDAPLRGGRDAGARAAA